MAFQQYGCFFAEERHDGIGNLLCGRRAVFSQRNIAHGNYGFRHHHFVERFPLNGKSSAKWRMRMNHPVHLGKLAVNPQMHFDFR
ncbi:hypothetical protein D3C75_1023070 [compost metagenome]